jgi:hypothetical protein
MASPSSANLEGEEGEREVVKKRARRMGGGRGRGGDGEGKGRG